MLKRILIILLSCMSSSTAMAACKTATYDTVSYCPAREKPYEWQRYAGVDFKYAGINPRGDWAKIFAPDYPTSNVYFGIRFIPQFGIELGYEAAKQSSKNHIFNGGQTFFGNAMPNVATLGKARFCTWHIDLCYFYPISPNFEDIDLFASVGLGVTRTSISLSALPNTDGTVTVPMNNMQMQKGTPFRARIGAEYMSTSFLGIRAMIGYDYTQKIKVKGIPAVQFRGFGVLTEPFKNSLSVSLGLIFKF